MTLPSGVVKIQKPSSKNYNFASIPNEVSNHLGAEKGLDLAWMGITLGTEHDNKDVAVAFIVDKDKDLEEQARRVLRLIEE